MNRRLVRCVAVGSMALVMSASAAVRAEAPAVVQVASVDQLKSEAFKDLRDGKFDQSNALLAQAAAISKDPLVKQMADWTNGFQTQELAFTSERHQQFEKRVDEMRLLLTKDKPEDALDRAALAFLLTDDKKAFRAEKDVDALVSSEEARADDFDRDEQWIQSQRIYQNLAQIDPSVPKWKDKLKLSMRRERLLALYTPTVFRQLLDSDTKLRDAADAIIHPTTQPTTRPAELEADSIKIDWHDTLHGIKSEMLWEALVYARNNWYRDVDYKTLAVGGLNGLKVVVQTRGLEQAFPHLGDAAARDSFLATIDQCIATTEQAAGIGEQTTLHDTLQKLELANQKTVALPEEVLVCEFADGAFGKLDQFSTVLWPYDLDDFKRTTQGEFSGVGIQIRSDPDGSLKVVQPLADSPAIKAGIKPEDVITRIDGKSAKGISTNQAVKIITGPAGTQVVLTVRSMDGTVRDYTLTRQTITVASIKGWIPKDDGWDYFIDHDQKIAYMRLTNFAGNTPKEMNAAIEQMKAGGAKGIILDLRFDPGGLLSSATEIADRFLKDGVIVSTRPDRDTGNPPTVAVAKPDDDDIDLPLVILVNQYSASASEIVSGALKDQKRAILVGERTFGKGSVQMLFPLSDKSAYFKLTTSHYYLPSGRCIHREENSTEWGVDPDVTVQMTPEQMSAAITAREDLDIPKQFRPVPAPVSAGPTSAPSTADAVEHAADPKAAHAGGEADPQAQALHLPDQAVTPTTAPAKTASAVKKDLLSVDPQLSAAVLILRLKVNGAAL
jgi:carboxyl-terminal processing protease